ncbi:CAAX prenyl protease-like protein [Murinocardiopsis flavida]|uniref:CAAX prenyl protease-like protein n=1 Tax=Murinocardiopsis flavida TaxID=645275 RepID=A0A2P8DE22_9ACTN|nr:CPBP family intramembrane glutamic endopeptidase [Murinocardiopsis flavida]PSK95455.1 CAAX prenyl protease-like protein [Murinocardiopsis flavida]
MPTTTPARRPSGLVLFFAVTFGTSWASWLLAIWLGGPAMSAPVAIPYVFGAFGPMVGALAVRVRRGRRGEPAPDHVVRLRPKILLWAPLLMALASASVVGGALIGHELGAPAVTTANAQELFRMAGGPVPFLISMLLIGPLSEEAGWRGTAYPRMRATAGRVRAGLVLGAVWGVWHLPLFFINGTVQADLGIDSLSGLLFALSFIPMTLLINHAYDRAGTFAAVAVHFAVNTTMVLVGVQAPVAMAYVFTLEIVLVLALLAAHRPASIPAARHVDHAAV